ncbi:MAG: pyridoxal-phosphate dependent enzyme [Telmatospirillum sp.]|nr:pyridoxal-phosphate dependent enzyme [Telmatospirillum sp.]
MTPRLLCPSCGQDISLAQGLFSCPCQGDGREHALDVRLSTADDPALPAAILTAWQARRDAGRAAGDDREGGDPLALFAPLSAARALAGPGRHAEAVARLQGALLRTEGGGVRVTPLLPAAGLARSIGHDGLLMIKDETGQVGGSHKARHLAGTMLFLEALRSRTDGGDRPRLAISSCGNAALAAAAVARAAAYRLQTFVPDDVSPAVARLLAERGAEVTIVPRQETGNGDPCYRAFLTAVAGGAVPFSCSGRDNWSNIDGGRTLGYETALGWRDQGVAADHLVIQVGGGALARSIAEGLELLHGIGLLARMPRIHVCQTEGAFPFVRAWALLLAEIATGAGLDLPLVYDRSRPPGAALAALTAFQAGHGACLREAAAVAARAFDTAAVQDVIGRAAANPRAYLWPWDGESPRSLAHGILDDETYDWFSLVRSLLKTGGLAVALPETLVVRAHDLARATTSIPVSATGSSGLAGLIALKSIGAIGAGDSVGLFFTGLER